MKIARIGVDGFGLLRDTSVEPSPGLTVVRGQNEAGKTTLLAFIRAILFGFETNRYRALAGGRRGGSLDVEMADGRHFRVERHGDHGGAGRLRVLDEAGVDQGPPMLPQLLQGVEARVFRNIFAFGLDELTQFERLTDDEVAARIYGAGLGLGAVSGLEVENELRESREALFKPGGQNPTINALLRDLDVLDGQLRKLDLPQEYGEAGVRLTTVDARLADLAVELGVIATKRRAAQRLVDGWPTWLDLESARQDRAELGDVRSYASDTLERHGSLETACTVAAEALTKIVERRTRRELDLAGLEVDDLVLDRRVELEAVLREAAADRTRLGEIQRLVHERDVAQAELDESLRRLGTDWTPEGVSAFDDSLAVQTEISGRFRTLLDRAAEGPAAVRRDLGATEHNLTDAHEELDTVDASLAEVAESLAERIPADDREAALRRVEQLAARLEAVRGSFVDDVSDEAPEAGVQPLLERLGHARALPIALQRERSVVALLETLPPTTTAIARQRVSLGALLSAMIGLIVAGLLIATGSSPAIASLVAAVGLAPAVYVLVRPAAAPDATSGRARSGLEEQLVDAQSEVAAHLAQLGLERTATAEQIADVLEDLERRNAEALRRTVVLEQAARAAPEVAELTTGLEAACTVAGLSATPTAPEIDEMRRSIAADRQLEARRVGLLQQQSTVSVRIETLERRQRGLEADLLLAERDATTAQDEWVAWLTRRGIDPTVDRETAARIVDTVTAAKRPLATLRSLDDRIVSLRADHATFLTAFAGLEDMLPGGRFDENHVPESVGELSRRISLAEEQNRDRQRRVDELTSLTGEEEEARLTDERARDAYRVFLAEIETINAATLRTEVERSNQAEALDARIATGSQALASLSGPGEALAGFEEALGTLGDIGTARAQIEELAAATESLETERRGLHEEAGALRNRRAEMEHDIAATEDRQRRSDLQARLEAAAERWSVLALATEIVMRTRAAYERAHRPAVVETAERYFRDWTDGRYGRIVAPLGRQIEAVEHRDGTQVPLAGLSRGTAEQLYLALRFGLVEHFAAGAEPLPIVMDDILVNFDDERAARAARSIEELATRQQVIYFTCHPAIPLRGASEIVLPQLRTVADSEAPVP